MPPLSRSGRFTLAAVRLGVCAGLVAGPFLGPPVGAWRSCQVPPLLWPPAAGLFSPLQDDGQRQLAVALGLGFAFLAGHLISYRLDPRRQPSRKVISRRVGASDTHWRRPTLRLLVVVAILTGFVGLLFYEWIAVHLQVFAISYYVRCGNWIATYRTLGLAAAATFVLGSWLRFGWRRS